MKQMHDGRDAGDPPSDQRSRTRCRLINEMDRDELIRQALEQFAEAKDEFCQAHKEGTEALRRGDFEAVLQAIAAESGAIEKQKAATRRLTSAVSARASSQAPHS